METNVELSPETRKRIEDIAVASFHNLLLGIVEQVTKQIEEATCHVSLVHGTALRAILKEIEGPGNEQ